MNGNSPRHAVGLATSFLEDQYASGYYDQQFNSRLGYAPLYSQSALFVHYVLVVLRGEPTPPLGTGFDRWFLFLGKAGVSWWPMAAVLGAAVFVMAWAGLSLTTFWRADDLQCACAGTHQ